jgi:hypothetical protein
LEIYHPVYLRRYRFYLGPQVPVLFDTFTPKKHAVKPSTKIHEDKKVSLSLAIQDKRLVMIDQDFTCSIIRSYSTQIATSSGSNTVRPQHHLLELSPFNLHKGGWLLQPGGFDI